MEEILVNIDSRYRDTLVYPNESKFRYTMEKTIKNISSIRLVSLEINNSINYISSKRKNNYLRFHLPNKLNDPIGIRIELEDGLLQLISSINKMINSILDGLINTNAGLQTKKINDEPVAEKYFYIFYLNDNAQFNFSFNDNINNPASLHNPFILEKGWHSIYGVVLRLKEYVRRNYNDRKLYKTNNPDDTSSIDLDSGNFYFTTPVSLNIWDRRFRKVTTTLVGSTTYYQPDTGDCIRTDTLQLDNFSYLFNDLETNLSTFTDDFYKIYLYDTTNFIVAKTPADYPILGILDQLNTNSYVIPVGYVGAGTNMLAKSYYYLNNAAAIPTLDNTQIYNITGISNLTTLRVSIVNSFTKPSAASGSSIDFYYYWMNIRDSTQQSWSTSDATNTTGNLTDKDYLLYHGFITIAQFNDPAFKPNMKKDIAEFQVDFNTYTDLNTYVINNTVDIHKMQYPPLGFYLGYRPDLTKTTEKFLLSPTWLDADAMIVAPKMFSTTGDSYIFMRINDWGYFDFFNRPMFAKILMTTGLGNPKIDDGLAKEYRFRQPVNIQRLDIELVDYLGNTLDLNGNDYSLTIEFRVFVNSTQKVVNEKQGLAFS
jgi:hypothetical protein